MRLSPYDDDHTQEEERTKGKVQYGTVHQLKFTQRAK